MSKMNNSLSIFFHLKLRWLWLGRVGGPRLLCLKGIIPVGCNIRDMVFGRQNWRRQAVHPLSRPEERRAGGGMMGLDGVATEAVARFRRPVEECGTLVGNGGQRRADGNRCCRGVSRRTDLACRRSQAGHAGSGGRPPTRRAGSQGEAIALRRKVQANRSPAVRRRGSPCGCGIPRVVRGTGWGAQDMKSFFCFFHSFSMAFSRLNKIVEQREILIKIANALPFLNIFATNLTKLQPRCRIWMNECSGSLPPEMNESMKA